MPLNRLLPDFSVKIFLFWFLLFGGFSFWIPVALTVAVAILLCSQRLRKPPLGSSDVLPLPGSPPYVIGHRGAGFDAPENTIAAIKQAKKNGATAVEFDVDYTSDGVAVVFHDDTVDRCTDGSGKLSEMTLEKVKQLNASAHHRNGEEFPNERVPTLVEVVEFCLANDLMMFIDVKTNVKLSTTTLVNLFQQYPALYKKAIVCSFNPLIVYSVRSKDPGIVGGLTHRSRLLSRKVDKTEGDGPFYKKPIYPFLDVVLEWSHYCWLWFLCGNSVFLANIGDVCASTVEHFARRGIQVVVWTANGAEDRAYFLKSLRCPIISDTMDDAGCDDQKN